MGVARRKAAFESVVMLVAERPLKLAVIATGVDTNVSFRLTQGRATLRPWLLLLAHGRGFLPIRNTLVTAFTGLRFSFWRRRRTKSATV